jgi:ABC-type branched-subunit amino acid transport system substrate-binding protein
MIIRKIYDIAEAFGSRLFQAVSVPLDRKRQRGERGIMLRSRHKLIGVAVAVAFIAMGCSSSKKASSGPTTTSNGSTTSGAPTTAPSGAESGKTPVNIKASQAVKNDPLTGTPGSGLTRGVTATSVKVGCFGQISQFAGLEDGIKARLTRANAAGGVAGRTINFTGCQDDGSSTQQNLQLARQLVEQNQVFATMGVSANMLSGTTDYLNQNQVPFFGWGFLPGFCGTRWGFGYNGCLISDDTSLAHGVLQANLADAMVKASGLQPSAVRAGFSAGDDDSGKIGNIGYNKIYKQRGLNIVYSEANVPAPGPPADFSPFVNAILAANPNILLVSTAFPSVAGMHAALAAAGYKGFAVNFTDYVPGLLDASPQLASSLEGAYISSQIVPQEQNTEWTQQESKDLMAVNAKAGGLITLGAAIGYAEAEMFVEQLQAIGQNLNTKTFDDTINGGSFTFAPPQSGGPGVLQYPSGHQIPADCAAIMKVVNKKYVVQLPFQCYDSPIVRGTGATP